MKILLTGSSGFIGRHVSDMLIASGHDVLNANRMMGIDFNHMIDVNDWVPYLKSVDVVINCVGIIVENHNQHFDCLHKLAPVAIFRACEKANVSRVIQVSALGADEHAFTGYQLSKKAADDELRKMPYEWFILRPSLVYGEDSASTRFFRKLAKLPVLLLANGGNQQIQPVHIDDLVIAIQKCITTLPARQTIDIVGPRVMSFAEWMQLLRYQMGKSPAVIISMPFILMLFISYFLRFIYPLFHSDNLRMLQQGNTSSDNSLQRLLGRKARDFS